MSTRTLSPTERRIVRPHERMSDTQLLDALRRGDEDAFTALCGRHEPALRRYARHVLRARPAIVDDVVQESLLRAHRALKRDDRHIEVKPYLFRLVRNCCLDELARVRTDSVPLHMLHAGDEPASAPDSSLHDGLELRTRVGATLDDLAALPELQRHALVRREIDGLTHEQVAAELGITPGASRSLVYRAREALTRADGAREARCEDVRFALLKAHDDKRRAPVGALRHVASCGGCRAFRASLKSGRRALTVLMPGLMLAGGAVSGGGLLAGGAKSVATKVAVVGVGGALAAGGALELQAHVFSSGTPSPIPLSGVALPGGRLAAGAPLPAKTALVTERVTLPATSATLACPAGTRVAGLVPVPGTDASQGFDEATVIGASTSARIVFGATGGAQHADVAILCRVPDPGGSVRASSATTGSAARAGGAGTASDLVVHTCRRRATLSSTLAGRAIGTVTSGEPLQIIAGRTGWLKVRTDANRLGWIRAAVAC